MKIPSPGWLLEAEVLPVPKGVIPVAAEILAAAATPPAADWISLAATTPPAAGVISPAGQIKPAADIPGVAADGMILMRRGFLTARELNGPPAGLMGGHATNKDSPLNRLNGATIGCLAA